MPLMITARRHGPFRLGDIVPDDEAERIIEMYPNVVTEISEDEAQALADAANAAGDKAVKEEGGLDTPQKRELARQGVASKLLAVRAERAAEETKAASKPRRGPAKKAAAKTADDDGAGEGEGDGGPG